MPAFLLVSALLWFLTAGVCLDVGGSAFVTQLTTVLVLSFVLIHAVLLPAVANQESYKSFVEAVERDYGSVKRCIVFPRDWTIRPLSFMGAKVFSYLAGTPTYSWKNSSGLGTMSLWAKKNQSKSRRIRSFSFAPLLRSQGTGPDRDNPLILVRGAKS